MGRKEALTKQDEVGDIYSSVEARAPPPSSKPYSSPQTREDCCFHALNKEQGQSVEAVDILSSTFSSLSPGNFMILDPIHLAVLLNFEAYDGSDGSISVLSRPNASSDPE